MSAPEPPTTSAGSPQRLAAPALAIITSFAMAIREASDPDLGFHLATGRAILAMGRLPTTNVLSFAEPQQEWVLQQGIPAVLFELFFQAGGIAAVILFKAAVIGLTYAFVFAAARRLSGSSGSAAFAVLMAAAAAAHRFVERPLIVSNLMLALVLYCLARVDRAGRRGPWLAGAATATAFACHMHAGAVFSFLLILAVAAGRFLDGLRPRTSEARRQGWRAGAALTVTAVSALVLATATLALYHPFPLRVLEVPFKMGQDPFLKKHLIEFRAPWAFPFGLLRTYWVFLGLVVVTLVRVRRGRLALSLPVLGFALLSLWFVRLADTLSIVAAPLVAVALAGSPIPQVLRPRMARFALIATAVISLVDIWGRHTPRLTWNPQVFPVALAGFVEQHQLRGPTFASDGWAGPYLAWFYPDETVYFFPAFDAFSPEHVRRYVDVRYGRPGWAAELDRHGVELILLKHTSAGERVFQKSEPNLRQHLVADARWTLVAFDDFGAVFVRSDGINSRQAAALAITGVDPDRMRSAGVRPDSLPRLEAARGRGPASERIDMLIELLKAKRRYPPSAP